MTSPTSRSLVLLRRSGCFAAVVERWIPKIDRRADLFGFGDILAVRRGEQGSLIVQATTRPNVSSRLNKAKRRPELAHWLAAGNRFEVWGWYRRNGAPSWDVVRVAVRPGDLASVTLSAPTRRSRKSRQKEFAFTLS